MSFSNIPDELKQYNQWICWKYVQDESGKWQKIPVRAFNGANASTTNPLDWSSFDRAVTFASSHNIGIGFVFTKSDPYCGADLDDSAGNADIIQLHSNVYQTLNSYSEWSPSGKGVHIIVRASLPEGGKHPKYLGLFDNQRYFTFTGNVCNPVPIADRQAEITAIHDYISKPVNEPLNIVEEPENYADNDVIAMARCAGNGAKFDRLFSGDWLSDYGGQSQSEADFALVNIIGFYSRNVNQTVRLFRQSKLANRVKATRGKYVETMARRALDRLTPSITIPEDQSAAWFDASQVAPWVGKDIALPVDAAAWIAPAFDNTVYPTPPAASPMVAAAPGPQSPPDASWKEHGHLTAFNATDYPDDALDLPAPEPLPYIPGMVGELAIQCWNGATFQMAEASIASALSTMSVLCSRSYRHGSLGLSLYLLLLAKTSVGKSFAFKANDNWYNKLMRHYGSMTGALKKAGDDRAKHLEGLIFGEIGSAQGLSHHIAESPASLFHADEYVDKIRTMASVNPPPLLSEIRSELLRLMEMSGPGRIYRGRKYSMRSSSAAASVNVVSASLSILATGTPEQFFDELSPSLLTSGFLPRFTIFSYTGGISRPNYNPVSDIEPALFGRICALFDMGYNKSLVISGEENELTNVQSDNEASHALSRFDNYCLRKVKEAHDTHSNMDGMWSRCATHVRQVASLIAIGCNAIVPTITEEHVGIAISIVRPGVDKIERKIVGNEVGTGDNRLEADLRDFVYRMRREGWQGFRNYSPVKSHLISNGYYQVAAIKNYCSRLAAFRNHRLGSTMAFNNTLNELVKLGEFKRVDVNGVACITIQ